MPDWWPLGLTTVVIVSLWALATGHGYVRRTRCWTCSVWDWLRGRQFGRRFKDSWSYGLRHGVLWLRTGKAATQAEALQQVEWMVRRKELRQ